MHMHMHMHMHMGKKQRGGNLHVHRKQSLGSQAELMKITLVSKVPSALERKTRLWGPHFSCPPDHISRTASDAHIKVCMH